MSESTELFEQLRATGIRAAHSGAEVLRHYFRREGLEIEEKERHDFVTRADHESEARILEVIREAFPESTVLAEESGYRQGQGGELTWIVDPLDGTSNFLQGLPVFCISIGCLLEDDVVAGVVYDPLGDNLFTGVRGGGALWNDRPMKVSRRSGLEGAFLATGYPFRAREALELYLDVFRDTFLVARGIRRCGSAALDLAYTAAGVYDGFFEFRLSPWDIAAGMLLTREAGGLVSDLDGGGSSLESGNVIAGPATLQGELLDIVQRYVSEERLEIVHPRSGV